MRRSNTKLKNKTLKYVEYNNKGRTKLSFEKGD